jgi:hypothetical protein
MPRILAYLLLLTSAALAQSADITGWHNLSWGTKKTSALKILQPLRVHDSGPDGLAIDVYRHNGIAYEVGLFFSPADGLQRVTLTATDEKSALDKSLAELTSLYGKPEFQSEYDGELETIQNKWVWTKPRGKVSLESIDGMFAITYEMRSDRDRK